MLYRHWTVSLKDKALVKWLLHRQCSEFCNMIPKNVNKQKRSSLNA